MSMNFEETYFELLENYDRAKDKHAKTLSVEDFDNLLQAKRIFQEFCTVVLEKILEKNSNILENLK